MTAKTVKKTPKTKKIAAKNKGTERTEFCFNGTLAVEKTILTVQGADQVDHSQLYIDDAGRVFAPSSFIITEDGQERIQTVSPRETSLIMRILEFI